MNLSKPWYTTSDLAIQIGVSRKTVWSWIRDGKLKSQRYGSHHRISTLDLQCFLANCNSDKRGSINGNSNMARREAKSMHERSGGVEKCYQSN
jgi:excisionase family DNA binding protein